MYFRPEENRADGPTRHRDPDPLDAALPSGSKRSIQVSLKDSIGGYWTVGHRPNIDDDLPFEDISGFDAEQLQPSSRVRRKVKVPDAAPTTCTAELDSPTSKVTFDPTVFCPEAISILESFNENQFIYEGKSLKVDCRGGLDLYSGCGRRSQVDA